MAAILYLVQNLSQSDSEDKSGERVKGRGKEKRGYWYFSMGEPGGE